MQDRNTTQSRIASDAFDAAGPLLISLCLAACGAITERSENLGDTANEFEDTSNTPSDVSAFAGSWIGEAEAPLDFDANGTPGTYAFPSGSTQFRLEFRPGREATLAFGQSPAPAVTSFDVGYPSGVDYLSAGLWDAPAPPPIEGIAHQFLAIDVDGSVQPAEYLRRMDDKVMRFVFLPTAGFAEWCDGQVPHEHQTYYSCLQGPGSSIALTADGHECKTLSLTDPAVVEIDCNVAYLCGAPRGAICVCDDTECLFNGEVTASLFVRRIGNELIGTFSGAVFFNGEGLLTTLGTVRFQRVSD